MSQSERCLTKIPPAVFDRLRVVVLMLALLSPFSPTPRAQAQTAPDATTSTDANGWGFTSLLKVGELGFSELITGRIGDNGTVALYGTRNEATGLYVISGGQVVPVVVEGMVLSGTLGTVDEIATDAFNVDPDDRVVFRAHVINSSLPAPDDSMKWPTFRWDDGLITHMLPSASNVAHAPNRMTSRGEWMTETQLGEFANGIKEYKLTNGTVITPLLSFTENIEGCTDRRADFFGTANTTGGFAYYSFVNQRPPIIGDNGCDNFSTVTHDWTLTLSSNGATSTTIASGNKTTVSLVTNGTDLDFGQYLLNDNGDVLYVKYIYTNADDENAPTGQQLILHDEAGDSTLFSSDANHQVGAIVGLDNAKRVAFALYVNNEQTLYAGSNLTTDKVIGPSDSLFGGVVTSVNLQDVSAPAATFGDKRIFLFYYALQDGPEGFAIASKGVTRWTNAQGGAWSTAANWSPAEIPGATAETLFDQEATYEVSVGTRTSGRSSVQKGNVNFMDADLELVGPLTVGQDANLTIPEGTVVAGDLIVGDLPPVNPENEPLAKLNLFNAGTVFTATGQTRIGDAGPGELFISGARLDSTAAEIGGRSPGTVIVGLPEGFWGTENLAIGAEMTGTLTIERGAFVRANGQAVIGEGVEEKAYLATVTIDNEGTTALGPLGNWAVGNILTIGNRLRGALTLLNGGLVGAFGIVQMGLVGRNDRNNFDATLEISGVGDDNTTPSSFYASEELLVGMDAGARTSILVNDGGYLSGFGLSLAHEEGSIAYLMVDGVHASGIRSTFSAGTVGGADSCAIGYNGRAQVTIGNGALFTCRRMTVGNLPGSHGQIMVDGQAQGKSSTLAAADIICVGGSVVCGGVNGPTGRLTLQNGGTVQTNNFVVSNGGTLAGNGQIAVGFSLIAGAVAPGIDLVPTLEELELQAASLALAQQAAVGTLTLSGTVTLSNTAVITIDVSGESNFDQLLIKGNATLDGKLVLNFSNGYAPQQGDTFAFLQSATSSGQFANVVIQGLAPGFDFDVTTSNGNTQLIANNDGVATTEPNQPTNALKLPFLRR